MKGLKKGKEFTAAALVLTLAAGLCACNTTKAPASSVAESETESSIQAAESKAESGSQAKESEKSGESSVSSAHEASRKQGAVVSSGSCGADGDNVKWELHSGGLLVISGSGDMENLEQYTSPPYDTESVRSVRIDQGVTSIGDYFFMGCYSLSEVEIPEGVAYIGNSAFESSSLTSVEIPASVAQMGSSYYTYIDADSYSISPGSSPFSSCNYLESISVDENNTAFSSEDGVLFDKNKTKLVYCPDGKSGAYTVPEGVSEIDGFGGCRKITSVKLPSSVTQIESGTFQNCDSLESINIPEGIENIDTWCFAYCKSLKSVEFPESVKSIGAYAFQYCDALTSLTIPDSVEIVDYGAFQYCDGLKSVKIGSKKIEGWAFRGCEILTNAELSEGVESIGEEAFYHCSILESITLPSSIKSVGNNFINGWDSQTVYIKGKSESDWPDFRADNAKVVWNA